MLHNLYVYIILLSLVTGNDPSSMMAEQPYFDDISPRNVTTVVDESIILKCRVKNKGNRTVSNNVFLEQSFGQFNWILPPILGVTDYFANFKE